MDDKTLQNFPIATGYRFVDQIESVSDEGIRASCTFPASAPFYAAHFPGRPITPGSILAETMAQIGLLAYGMYLLRTHPQLENLRFLLTSSDLKYRGVVLPEERVTVTANLIYFRFRKLKCKARMEVKGRGTVCQGTISGIIIFPDDEEA